MEIAISAVPPVSSEKRLNPFERYLTVWVAGSLRNFRQTS